MAAQNRPRDPRLHATDEQGEPAARSDADTRRIADARHRSRRINRGQVYGKASGPRRKLEKTLVRNHAAGIASVDLFVVQTISLKLLYGLVILRHARATGESQCDEAIRLPNGLQVR